MGARLPAPLKRPWPWLAAALLLLLFWEKGPRPWLRFHANEHRFIPTWHCDAAPPSPCPSAAYPATWDIRAAHYADVTGDGAPECVLLVWRPWRDWPIMRWREGKSPIADFRDAQGDSAHVIVTEPDGVGGYREVWAGSALPIPLCALEVGDVDGDGLNELVALDTDYVTGRAGPGRAVSVWAWNDFGFSIEWRSGVGRFYALRLTPPDADGAQAVCVRGNFTGAADVVKVPAP